MGLFIKPVKINVQGITYTGVQVEWDNTGESVVSLRELSTDLCLSVEFIWRGILMDPANDLALEELEPFADKFIRTHKEEWLEKKQILLGSDDEGQSHAGLDFGSKMYAVASLNPPVDEWKIDLYKIPGIFLRLETTSVWKQCRKNSSILKTKTRKQVDDYRKAVEAFLPELEKIEKATKHFDKKCKQWRETKGKSAVEAFSLLTVNHCMVSVYARQDRKAAGLADQTKEIATLAGDFLRDDLMSEVSGELNAIKKLYYDKNLCNKFLDYLMAWDPSIIYYFDALATKLADAKTKETASFKRRVDEALVRATEILSMDIQHIKEVANELDNAGKKTWDAVVAGNLASSQRLTLEKFVRDMVKIVLNPPSTKSGLLGVVAIWSGTFTTYFGNMEGPPSVASLMLKAYSGTKHFVETLKGRDGLLKLVVMWGFDPIERQSVLTLMKSESSKARELANQLYNNGTWRSPSVFFAFWIMGSAIAAFHIYKLVDDIQSGRINGVFEDEFIKQILPIFQDMFGFALTGITQYYSRTVDAALRARGLENIKALSGLINSLETGMVAKAAQCFHIGIASIGFVLAVWNFVDEKPRADKVEEWMHGLTVLAGFVSLVGSIAGGSLAGGWLGPIGFVGGILIGFALGAYQLWIKSSFTAAMQSIGGTVLSDSNKIGKYLGAKGSVVVKQRAMFIFFVDNVTFKELLEETYEQLIDFSWEDLRKRYIPDYYHEGLKENMIAQLYGVSVSDVKSRIKADNAQKRAQRLASMGSSCRLTRPSSSLVKFRMGAVNEIMVELIHPKRGELPVRMWLEIPDHFDFTLMKRIFTDPEDAVRTSYDPASHTVVLHQHASTSFGRIYRGAFRLNRVESMTNLGSIDLQPIIPEDQNSSGTQPKDFTLFSSHLFTTSVFHFEVID